MKYNTWYKVKPTDGNDSFGWITGEELGKRSQMGIGYDVVGYYDPHASGQPELDEYFGMPHHTKEDVLADLRLYVRKSEASIENAKVTIADLEHRAKQQWQKLYCHENILKIEQKRILDFKERTAHV